MSIQFTKAQRKQAKLRLAISGPAGSGKTYSALEIAFGLGGKIAVIDTEHGSADLYTHLGDYYSVALQPPFRVEDYIEAVHAAEQAGFDVIVIDSLTHAWAGEGGLLDQQGKIAESSPSKNSYMAWNKITPMHYRLIETMLQSSAHIIATMRSKTAYVLDNSEGKNKPVRIGTAPMQRDGMEYEFTIVLDLNANHSANIVKDRTSLFRDDYFVPTRAIGEQLLAWLNSGAAPLPQPPRASTAMPAAPPTATVRSPPKVLPNGTPTPTAAAPAEDPAQHAGHINDERYCFDCGAKIDPSREGRTSKRDFGRYLCLEHLKKAKDEEAANAKPIAKPAAPKAAPPAAPKAVAEGQRDQPSTSPLASTIAEINARQDEVERKQQKAPLPPLCAGCGKSVTANEMSASLKVCPETLCAECLALMQDAPQKPGEMA